jgi:hypothetical protein
VPDTTNQSPVENDGFLAQEVRSATSNTETGAAGHVAAAHEVVERATKHDRFMVVGWYIEDGRIIQEHAIFEWPDEDFPRAWALLRDKLMEIRNDPATKTTPTTA